MKRVRIAACLLGLTASGLSVAAPMDVVSTVKLLRSHDSSWFANVDWFALDGVTSLGGCPTYNGYVVFRLKDDERGKRQFTTVMSAKLASAPVTVDVDDTYLDSSGYCLVKFVQL